MVPDIHLVLFSLPRFYNILVKFQEVVQLKEHLNLIVVFGLHSADRQKTTDIRVNPIPTNAIYDIMLFAL